MRVLCPTDFSRTSHHAVRWAFDFLNEREEAGRLEIVHCLNVRNRGDLFARKDDVVRDRAHHDLDALHESLGKHQSETEIGTALFDSDPKSFIPDYAQQVQADLVLIGSQGLTALKDLTFGSVAEVVAKRSKVPVLIVPLPAEYQPLTSVAMGIGSKTIENPASLSRIQPIFHQLEKIYAVYVDQDNTKLFPAQNRASLQEAFETLPVEFLCLPEAESVMTALRDYAVQVNANIISIIHQERHWLNRLFHASTTKEAIYNLQRPLLIMRDIAI